MKIKLIVISLLLILILQCGDDKKNNIDDLSNLKVDNTKLASSIVDSKLGIKFKPPIKWKAKEVEFSKKVENFSKNQNSSETFFYNPVYLFFDDSTKSLLSVGYIESSDSTLSITKKMDSYKKLINDKYHSYNLKVKEFDYLNIPFTQITYERGNFISNKILFIANKMIISFDFTVLKDYYNSEIKFIKATIGSIELLKN